MPLAQPYMFDLEWVCWSVPHGRGIRRMFELLSLACLTWQLLGISQGYGEGMPPWTVIIATYTNTQKSKVQWSVKNCINNTVWLVPFLRSICCAQYYTVLLHVCCIYQYSAVNRSRSKPDKIVHFCGEIATGMLAEFDHIRNAGRMDPCDVDTSCFKWKRRLFVYNEHCFLSCSL